MKMREMRDMRLRFDWIPEHSLTSLVNTTRLNLDFLISAPNLVFCTAIESPDRVLYIPANGVFQNLVVVERAVAESVAD